MGEGVTTIGTESRSVAQTEGDASAAQPPVELTGLAALRALLRIRPFRRLWLVLGLSSLGDWLGLLATSTFASEQVSGTAAKGAAFGSVIAVRLLPALILGPLAGVLADRWDRRLTMVVCDIIRFALFASIPAISLVTENPKLVVGWAAVATFIIETVAMIWVPAKEASVPNLLPKGRLETANQVTLATTYGLTPVAAALVLAAMNTGISAFYRVSGSSPVNPTHIALYFNALTFLATAATVFFGIREISGRIGPQTANRPNVLREFVNGWSYVTRTPLVRGLVLGILGAFAGGGVVVGTAQLYARSLGGGDSTFYILFAVLFVGLGLGVVLGPRLIGALSRRRWFGLSIILAAISAVILAFAWHLVIAVVAALGVGVGAGMAFLSGVTLLGTEVGDDVRGRVFAFVQTGVRVVLMFAITIASVLVGLGGSRKIFGVSLSTTRLLLLAAGVFGLAAGLAALRQMDDKIGVPLLADLMGSLRGRPLTKSEAVLPHGLFIVFEGGEGAGKSTQATRLAQWLRAEGRDVVTTREPGSTEVGAQIRGLLLQGVSGGAALAPRAEALLYAADRAHHVSSVVRPALARGAIVISDRYVDSSLAYQGAGRTLPVDDVSWLSSWATGGLKPDLVVLLDVDPAEGLSRVSDRGEGTDRLESEALSFHERVRYAFLDLAAGDPKRYLVLDASLPSEVLTGEIANRVTGLLHGRGIASPPASPPGPPPNGAPPSAGPDGTGQSGTGQSGSGPDGTGQSGSGPDGAGQPIPGRDGTGQQGSVPDGAGRPSSSARPAAPPDGGRQVRFGVAPATEHHT